MKKTIINGVILGVSFLITVWLGSLVWGALTTVTSGTSLTANTWNEMIGNFFWKQNGTSIYYNSGNVGIGLTSSSYNLSIKSNDENTVLIKNGNIDLGIGVNATYGGLIGTNTNNNFGIETNNGIKFYITTGGNVGIGTINPSSKLDVVGGSIKSSGFLVPGYVGEALQNGGYTNANPSWVDIPGVSMTFTLDSSKIVNMRAYGSVTAGANVGSNSYTHCGFRFNIDNVGYGDGSWGERILGTTNSNGTFGPWRTPFSMERNLTLSAGTHTIKVQGIGWGVAYPSCVTDAGELDRIKLFVDAR